ncbi:DapH/DapD/GlmU-related protein [uncultured Methanoregula sp.]|uniref:DapH/DapD/GlmU-related protein n=1 Tax=uncultured Methanoregula sp. TaxID=1005933 RepID=UPI002AAC44D4|nr:DapH/DapD/GlmU-related protein [uncultured Methanoregula sp.]
MKLSEFLPEKTEIARDGDFSSMGTFFSRYPQLVVYAARENDIALILENPFVSCVITSPPFVSRFPERIGIAVTPDPRSAFYLLQSALSRHPDFALQPFPNRISPSAKIHPSAVIAPESVEIGRDVVIGKNVVVGEQSIIDDGSVVRPNSIIGDDPRPRTGETGGSSIQPSGGVHLHRDVDIHANTRIHRAIFKGCTEIGEQTKIDNLDSVGQGTMIGKRCLICAGVTIGESVLIGDDAWIGPNVTLENQIAIGNNVYITLGSTVTNNVGDDKVVKDNYAIDRKRFRKVIRGM